VTDPAQTSAGAERRPVAIWHEALDGPARASSVTESAARLPHRALARLIARHVLDDPEARVVIDHVVELPPAALASILPAATPPLAPNPEDLEEASGQALEVADAATGSVRVMSARCGTCIYRRALREALGASVPALIREARESGGFVICHETLPAWQHQNAVLPPAICHGYANQYPDIYALRIARTIGRIEPVDPPPTAPDAEHDPEI